MKKSLLVFGLLILIALSAFVFAQQSNYVIEQDIGDWKLDTDYGVRKGMIEPVDDLTFAVGEGNPMVDGAFARYINENTASGRNLIDVIVGEYTNNITLGEFPNELLSLLSAEITINPEDLSYGDAFSVGGLPETKLVVLTIGENELYTWFSGNKMIYMNSRPGTDTEFDNSVVREYMNKYPSHFITGFTYTPPEEEEEQDIYQILIKGQLVDQLTEEPVEGANLFSAYEFSPSEVITDENGNFEFTIRSDFKIKEGPETGNSSIVGHWSFLGECYDYADVILQRDYGGEYAMALRRRIFDGEETVEDVSGKNIVDLGKLKMYPNADISIRSDKNLRFTVQYKYKNLEGYNGAGNTNYRTEHSLSSALPLDYDTFILFEDDAGNEYKSSTYNIPLEAYCKVVSLKYFRGESEWSIISVTTPTEETGPIEIPEEVTEEEKEESCNGCVLENKCYPYNYRKSGTYCSIETGSFEQQLSGGLSCENNFECESNSCLAGECVESSLLRKILSWFRNLFG
jgi:hypothetical protein